MATTPAAPAEEKLGLNDKAKAAAKATALTAEKTKLTTVSLPNAYAALGQDCFKAKRWATEFPDHYKELGDLATQLGDATRRLSVEAPSNAGMMDKAKSLAAKGVEAARIQKLKVQTKLGLAKFGKAVFEKYGKDAGPPSFVSAIEPLVERLTKLKTEIGDQVTMAGGKKKLLWVAGVAAVVLLFALGLPGRETQLQQDGESRQARPSTPSAVSPNDRESASASFDLSKLRKVRLGMSEAEVARLLGPPSNETVNNVPAIRGLTAATTLKTWSYDPGTENFACLVFKEGRLSAGSGGAYTITE